MNICCVCNLVKCKKDLHPINEKLELVIREHLFSKYDRSIAAYPSNVCAGCRTNLYMLGRGEAARDKWLITVQKVNNSSYLV